MCPGIFIVRPGLYTKNSESKGFEPLEPFGSVVFKTTAFGHSANSLEWLRRQGSNLRPSRLRPSPALSN